MNNSAIQQHFVFRNTSSLYISIALILGSGIALLYGTKSALFYVFFLGLAVEQLWAWYKKRNSLLCVTRDGMELSDVCRRSDGEIIGSLSLPWSDIMKVAMESEDKHTALMVWTTAGQLYEMNVTYHIYLRRKKFEEAVTLCSGKPLGEVISQASASASAAASSGKYEVRMVDDMYGVVDPETERVLLPFEYDYIEDWLENEAQKLGRELLSVGKNEKYGFVDTRTWKTAIPLKYANCYSFSEGVAAVTMDGEKWCFVDRDGQTAIEGPFQDASTFACGLCAVKMEGKWGYIDRSGRLAIACQWDRALAFCEEGLAPVAMEDVNGIPTFGFVNRQGEMAVKYKFDSAWTHCEGLATVEVKGRWGYIDANGRIAIEPKYKSALDFENGVAEVTTFGILGSKYGSKTIRIDRRGAKIGNN